MTIYECPDEFNGILCGVYDAWMSRLGHEHVKLALRGRGNLEMFAEYRAVEESEDKLDKVIQAIRKKISAEAYMWIYNAALSFEEEKADRIYRFLIEGFRFGAGITKQIHIPAVYELFRLNRAVANEAHLLKEFVRFSQMEEGILFSEIGPKNDVLSLLAPHFADRLMEERWIIYDEHRKKAVVYDSRTGWVILSMDDETWQTKLKTENDGLAYQRLWQTFYESVAIKERENYVCQRGHLPVRFRRYMTEFKKQ